MAYLFPLGEVLVIHPIHVVKFFKDHFQKNKLITLQEVKKH